MVLLINNEISEEGLRMCDAIDAMESALKQYAEGLRFFSPGPTSGRPLRL